MKPGFLKNILLYGTGGLFLFNTLITTGCAWHNPTYKQIKPGLEALLDQKYDQNNFLMNNPLINQEKKMDFNKIAESIYDIKTRGQYSNKAGGKVIAEKYGKALALQDSKGEQYLLTVSHIVKANKTLSRIIGSNEPQYDPKIKKTISYDCTESKNYLMIDLKNGLPYKLGMKKNNYSDIPLTKIFDDKGLDAALFRIPKGTKLNCYPYDIGKKSELELGDRVYIIGNPLYRGTNLREGIISGKSRYFSKDGTSNKDYFTTSLPISPGDSGCPVIALRDGKIELVGLAQSVLQANVCISFIVGIDAIMDRIKNADTPNIYKSLQDRMHKPY